MDNLTPQVIVQGLDKYIVGQRQAKKAVAVALRNRIRRRELPRELQKEVTPKNILMIGPTGVGKTEIARRVAELVDAPLIKVEATKFTEVGYVGRDVESIIQDLVETCVMKVHEEKLREVQSKAEKLAAERLLAYLYRQVTRKRAVAKAQGSVAVSVKAQAGGSGLASVGADDGVEAKALSTSSTQTTDSLGRKGRYQHSREEVARLLENRKLEDHMIEIEIGNDIDGFGSVLEFAPGMTSDEIHETFNEFVENYKSIATRRKVKKVSVRDARRILVREEANKLVDFDSVVDTAIQRSEETGVVFIDEMDKLAGPKIEVGADISGEGVQRDLLPIVEGTTVMTRYGPIKTDHILFIAAGSFYDSKPADLIPEIQGRFPLRVELESLSQADLERILVEPENALTKQYQALLKTEDVDVVFAEDGVSEIARLSAVMNERSENIGARRLYTITEKVLEDLSFNASDYAGQQVVIDAAYVHEHIGDLIKDEDLSRYIL